MTKKKETKKICIQKLFPCPLCGASIREYHADCDWGCVVHGEGIKWNCGLAVIKDGNELILVNECDPTCAKNRESMLKAVFVLWAKTLANEVK